MPDVRIWEQTGCVNPKTDEMCFWFEVFDYVFVTKTVLFTCHVAEQVQQTTDETVQGPVEG